MKLRCASSSGLFAHFRQREGMADSPFITWTNRSPLRNSYFRVDLPRRQRRRRRTTTSTRIAYESSRWDPPTWSSRRWLLDFFVEEVAEEEAAAAVVYRAGNLFVSFCPPTQRRPAITAAVCHEISALAIIDFYNFPCPPLSGASTSTATTIINTTLHSCCSYSYENVYT